MTGDAAGLAALVVLMLMAVCLVGTSWRLQRRVFDEWTNPLGKPGSCPVCREGCAVRGDACQKCWRKQSNDRSMEHERARVARLQDWTEEQRATYLAFYESALREYER